MFLPGCVRQVQMLQVFENSDIGMTSKHIRYFIIFSHFVFLLSPTGPSPPGRLRSIGIEAIESEKSGI